MPRLDLRPRLLERVWSRWQVELDVVDVTGSFSEASAGEGTVRTKTKKMSRVSWAANVQAETAPDANTFFLPAPAGAALIPGLQLPHGASDPSGRESGEERPTSPRKTRGPPPGVRRDR